MRILGAEKWFFYLSILITALPVILFPFFPTMDGAAHLYNSNIIIELLSGNEELGKYFRLNPEIVPNWIGHFILSLFNSFLPAQLAEQILLVLYVVFLPLSFRKLVSRYNFPYLSYFIFPFTYTFLFYLGFYNLSIAFILLFYTLASWSGKSEKLNFRFVLVLFLLLSICWFSHIFIYGLLGLTLIIFILRDFIISKKLKVLLRESAAVFIAALPTLILSAVFFMERNFSSGGENLSLTELLTWLKDVRPIVALNYAAEGKLTQWLFYLILLLIGYQIIKRINVWRKEGWRNSLHPQDIFLLPTFIILYLYFTTPNDSGAGMMSDRYALLFFIFLIIWLASNSYAKWLNVLAIAIITMVNTGLVIRYINDSRDLSRQAEIIASTARFIEANSTVLPVNRSAHWLQPHFSNYLGIEKPLVILENYEAHTGWFPVLWNDSEFPSLSLGGMTNVQTCLWWKTNEGGKAEAIDYIFIWGEQKPEDDCAKELEGLIKAGFERVETGSGMTELYRRRK